MGKNGERSNLIIVPARTLSGAAASVLAVILCFFWSFGVFSQEGPCLHVPDGQVAGGGVSGPMKIDSVPVDAASSRKARGEGEADRRIPVQLVHGEPKAAPPSDRETADLPRLAQERSAFLPKLEREEFAAVGIPSHYAGFVTNYPHVDGASYNYYNTANEKMPLWGAASGAPSPGVENAIWIGGDFDGYILDECPAGGGCYVPPPADGVYRGWRSQGESSAPCSCPTVIQQCYFSSNRGISMFDLSFIPDRATVNSVSFEGVVAKQFGSGERINVSEINADRFEGHENISGTGFQFAYDDASMGHLYYTAWNVSGYAVGNPVSVTLNSTARTDVQSALQRNWFGLGLVSGAGETATTAYYFGALSGSASSDPPYLIVDYSYVVPDAAVLADTPAEEVTGDGEVTCAPVLASIIPNEAGGNPLHFRAMISDTVPVYFAEDFTSSSHVDWGLTDYYGMVKTSSHYLYDESGALAGEDTPCVQLDPLELIYGGAAYPYAKNYNVGWRYARPFVTHLASDTWTDEDYTPDGLGDAMMGFSYMEWASDSSISYPNTACATELGFPANVAAIGGYINSSVNSWESFEVAFEYDGDPGNYYSVGTLSNVSGSFFATVDPPAEGVTGVALFFTESNDGFASLADLQVFDSFIYDTSASQTVTSNVIASSSNPSQVIRHARLAANDEQPSGTSIAYEMSNDDGVTWHAVTKGVDFVFPTDGNQLRWRAHLSTSSRILTPRIYDLVISNLQGGFPFDSGADPSNFEENATLGGTFQTFQAAGAPEYSGTSYQARFNPQGLADGTWYWKTEAYAPAGTTDPGVSSEVWSFILDTDGSYPPASLGDVLRASLNSETSVTLDWSLATPQTGIHYHVLRSLEASVPGTLMTHASTMSFTDYSAVEPLIFYNILAADDCEAVSED